MSQWTLKLIKYTIHMYIVQYTCTKHMYNMYNAYVQYIRTFVQYKRALHMLCTMHMYIAYVQCICTIYMYAIHMYDTYIHIQ